MRNKTKKSLTALLTLSLLLVLLVSTAVSAGAVSVNKVDQYQRIPAHFNSADYGKELTWLIIREDGVASGADFRKGDIFEITLKDGAKWNRIENDYTGTDSITINGAPNGDTHEVAVQVMSDTTIDVYFGEGFLEQPLDVDIVKIPLNIDVGDVTGDIHLDVTSVFGGVSNSKHLLIATVLDGKPDIFAESAEITGKTGVGGTIRISELSQSALLGEQVLTMELPDGFEWDSIDRENVTFVGSFDGSASVVSITGNNGQKAKITFNFEITGYSTSGTIYIETPIKATESASPGDVIVSLSGAGFGEVDLLIAQYYKEVQPRILGDIDDDGNIGMQDVLLAYQSFRSKITLTEEESVAADVDKNGTVDMKDVLLIYQHFRGKITSFEP